MKNIFNFIFYSNMLALVLLITEVQASDQATSIFKLKRGVGACSNLPTEADNFVCKAIGWPDENARIDLIKQEFVNKYGMTVRWALFDYYYFFKGIRKCDSVKDLITDYLTARKDLGELWEKLGDKSECVRKGQGWIQTRNIELFSGASPAKEVPKESGSKMELKLIPAKKSAAVEVNNSKEKCKATREVACVMPKRPSIPKSKNEVFPDEEPLKPSLPTAKPHEFKSLWPDGLPKEYF